MSNKVESLKARIAQVEGQLQQLKGDLAAAELDAAVSDPTPWPWPLSAPEYERYGRQLIVPAVGIKGQLRLKASSVLIIGAGGLGCPAAAYIAGAGVGTLGIVDGDTVEASNLHRQIAHSTARVCMSKVDSAISYLQDLNPNVAYNAHNTHLTPQNAESIVRSYDLVLDCTDHPTSRYLISDICVLLRKPLVSASAFKTDGQLIVLNNPPAPQGTSPDSTAASPPGGPCYRCLFPRPPPPDSVVSCGEGGILGPVVGVMGVLQALEAIKLVAAGAVDHETNNGATAASPIPSSLASLLLFSGTSAAPFRTVRMRGRKKDCFACGPGSTLTTETLKSGSLDYVAFCGVSAPLEVLESSERVSAAEFGGLWGKAAGENHREATGDGPTQEKTQSNKPVLLDVREKEHFDICSIEGAVNVPIAEFLKENKVTEKTTVANGTPGNGKEGGEDAVALVEPEAFSPPAWWPSAASEDAPVYVVCRVGNDSQLAAKRLKDMGLDRGGTRFVGDIKGGMKAWKDEVDPTLPFT